MSASVTVRRWVRRVSPICSSSKVFLKGCTGPVIGVVVRAAGLRIEAREDVLGHVRLGIDERDDRYVVTLRFPFDEDES